MIIELEDVAKIVGAVLAILGIYALWRKRIQKEINNERDIKELRERVEYNSKRIDDLDEHYKEMVDRLYDNLFPNKRKQ